MDRRLIARELLGLARALTAAELPVGYFEVVRDFRITFGAVTRSC